MIQYNVITILQKGLIWGIVQATCSRCLLCGCCILLLCFYKRRRICRCGWLFIRHQVLSHLQILLLLCLLGWRTHYFSLVLFLDKVTVLVLRGSWLFASLIIQRCLLLCLHLLRCHLLLIFKLSLLLQQHLLALRWLNFWTFSSFHYIALKHELAQTTSWHAECVFAVFIDITGRDRIWAICAVLRNEGKWRGGPC